MSPTSATALAFKCENSICEVSEKGNCADGFTPPEACPHFGKVRDVLAELEKSLSPSVLAPTGFPASSIKLSDGEGLTIESVNLLMRQRPTKIIVIAGDKGSGKTTLITSIYGQFLKGPYVAHAFAESRSILGFEELCHFSRMASGLPRPDTMRTSLASNIKFYHLGVVSKEEPSTRQDLLLSDRAGEFYTKARDNSEALENLPELKKATVLVLLLDGQRVSNPKEFTNVTENLQQMLRSFCDGGYLSTESIVQIVTTKTDTWETSDNKDSIISKRDKFLQRLKDIFQPKLASITFFDISARDPSGFVPVANGVDFLFKSWLDVQRQKLEAVEITKEHIFSEFDALAIRKGERGDI